MNINQYKDLVESKLDIKGTLVVRGEAIIPNGILLTNAYIKANFLDDLYTNDATRDRLLMTGRLLALVREITGNNLFTSHSGLTLKEVTHA